MQNSPAVYDWNDLRHFLAVARSGSTLAAAKALRVNQTTVARRVAVLEEALGVRLFDRLQAGYRLTEAGQGIFADAERVEAEAEALQAKLAQQGRRTSGVIRVTTPETMANVFLTPCLVEFCQTYPDIRVEVAVSDRQLDLLRGEADVALRGNARPDRSGLVGRKVADVAWGVYCSRDYVRRRGCPRCIEDLNNHTVIGGEGASTFQPGVRWLTEAAPRAEVATRSNSLSNLMVAVKAGLGLGVIPCMVGDLDLDLIRCLPPVEEIQSDIWLITTEALKDVPRIRAFNDFVAGRMAALRPQMLGRPAADAAASAA